MTIQKKPEIIKLSTDELEKVKSRLKDTTLNEQDKKIILSVLSAYQWLYQKIDTAKFTMQRLKKMLGFKTERRSKYNKTKSQDVPKLSASEETSNTVIVEKKK